MVRYYIIRKSNPSELGPGVFAAYTPSGGPVTHTTRSGRRENIIGETVAEVRAAMRELSDRSGHEYVELTKPDFRSIKVPRGIYPAYATLPAGYGRKRFAIDTAVTPGLRDAMLAPKKDRLRRYGTKDLTLKEYNDMFLRTLGIRPNKLARSMLYQSEITDELGRMARREGLSGTMLDRIERIGEGRRLRKYSARSGAYAPEARAMFVERGLPDFRPYKKKDRRGVE